MNLRVIACTHQHTSLDLREKLAFSPSQTESALKAWQSQFPEVEAVLLSTCNRTELYLARDAKELPSIEETLAFLTSFHELDATELPDLTEELLILSGQDAAEHLFSVAASLDSMVLGEVQVYSQVKTAYQQASDCETAGPLLHAAFQGALGAAKMVTTQTTIQQRRVSIPSVAIADFASAVFETFDDKNVLVIGAGEMGEETLTYLRDAGAKEITVLNRSPEKAEALAEKWNGRTAPWDDLTQELGTADLVVSTTGASEPIVSLETFEEILKHRVRGAIFILDLAVPRDFDNQIANLPDVYLYSIDDLQSVCEANKKERASELPKAEALVTAQVERLFGQVNTRCASGIIQQLLGDWRGIRDSELSRLWNKVPELDERQRKEVEKAFDRLIGKLSHPPLESLREETRGGTGNWFVETFAKIFQIHHE